MTDPDDTADVTEDDARPSRVEALEAGRLIAERYRLLRPIGTGGMGAVWEAEQVALGRKVAVKVIRGGIDESDTARARFVREAKAAAGLESPHVVQIFDYGVDDGMPYIAMERLVGESLADRLDRETRLSPTLALAVVRQIGKALARAHAAQIVHRDLKPDNVFLCEDPDDPDALPTVKVLDFGIAKQQRTTPLDADTRSGVMLGTPYYMSPEHARNPRHADARSDLWSLGVIAYECLVGARPFDAESLPALSVQILVEDLPVPSQHHAVPDGFDAWFARALQRDPDQRFQSAREMTQALASALGRPNPSTLSTLSSEAGATFDPPASAGARRWIAPVVVLALAFVGYALLREPQPKPVADRPVATDDKPIPRRAAAVTDQPGTSAETTTGANGPDEMGAPVETTGAPATSPRAPIAPDKTKRKHKSKPPAPSPEQPATPAKVDDLEF